MSMRDDQAAASGSATNASGGQRDTAQSRAYSAGGQSDPETRTKPSEPPENLAEMLPAIRLRQSQLSVGVDRDKAALAGQQIRQQTGKRQLTDLERAVGELEKARAESAAAVRDTDQAVEAAQPLIKQLGDDIKTNLKEKVKNIDAAIRDKRSKVDSEWKELDERQTKRDEQRLVQTRKQSAYDDASARLVGLPEAIRKLTGRLKSRRPELVAATTAGDARKACVIAADIQSAVTELDRLRGPGCETELVKAVHAAATALETANGDLAKAENAVGETQAQVAASAADQAALEGSRAGDLQKLHEAPPDAAPQGTATDPEAQGA
ncbi:hypothetical protein [Geodermatophilus poikilotrophus]|uniref:Uncharacterized protein n=1 Tax=Geodermatophilus poikilotrophus TaxID=1333667 RepID=A0A1H9Z150_9ACTN|nr:hypothetical protein [Geodermatophilus poikilotrophus]SES75222.1 hypothetical protein SAMN04488546_0376 [Geodermatophilus poikilotrophus]